ncbi:MAG: class I SAM-dependent methyltransferase [Thermoanaerobaculia bacterium]
MTEGSLFDEIEWRDPASGRRLEPVISARTPAGVPLSGALRVEGSRTGYPIVDAVARLTPQLAARHSAWLEPLGLEPAGASEVPSCAFQEAGSVDSFGFQWSWNSAMRSEGDLRWRVAERFGMSEADFLGRLVLDAGAGAGDQSAWLLGRGASVVSVDLSEAIDVVAAKLRMSSRWFGVQGDVTRLPLPERRFDVVYCEGVLQHTRNSALAVAELGRVLRPGGTLLASHYAVPTSFRGRMRFTVVESLRSGVHGWERYKLLWFAGALSVLAYVPLLGWVVRRSGLAQFHAPTPEFRTTWTNTYDALGGHTFQRHATESEFRSYFEREGGRWEILRMEANVAVARRTA